MKTDLEYLDEIEGIMKKYVKGDVPGPETLDKIVDIFKPLWK